LGDVDLLLTKLMRDDPADREDALFIVQRAGLSAEEVQNALNLARIPRVPEIREQVELATRKLMEALRAEGGAPTGASP
jgi:hypothetical protein